MSRMAKGPSVAGNVSGLNRSGEDPLVISETFATVGIHTVEIAVWNCGMNAAQAVTSSLPVTVSEKRVYIYLPLVLRSH